VSALYGSTTRRGVLVPVVGAAALLLTVAGAAVVVGHIRHAEASSHTAAPAAPGGEGPTAGQESLLPAPLAERRQLLEELLTDVPAQLVLCPHSTSPAVAREWIDTWVATGIEGTSSVGKGRKFTIQIDGAQRWIVLRDSEHAPVSEPTEMAYLLVGSSSFSFGPAPFRRAGHRLHRSWLGAQVEGGGRVGLG
jgi:hypothetical protein